MKTTPIINSFIAGELSPKLAGRTDITQYYQSAAEIRNMIIEYFGGAKKAPGTYFVNEVKESDDDTIIRRFVFSDQQAYALEFGDEYIRFYRNGGAILETANTITNIQTVSSKALVTCASHGFSNLDTIYIADVGGMTEVNSKRFLVSDQTTDAFYLKDTDGDYIDPSDYEDYTSGGTASRVYSIATSYPSSILRNLQFAEKNDLLYITSGSYPQAILTRTGHTSWTLEDVDYSEDPARPALMDENVDDGITITPSALTGDIVLTSSGASLFDETHVGSIWAIGPVTGSFGYAQIVSVSASGLKTVATANVLYGGTMPGTAAYSNWSEPAWSGYRGYPKCVSISEQRLNYGHTKSEPQKGWASYVGSYNNFETGSEDADAITFQADTNQTEILEWLFPAQEILIGTSGGVTTYGTGSDTLALTPTTGRIKKKSGYGAEPKLMPKMIGNSVFYWQEYGRILREYSYSLDKDNYSAKLAMKLSEHITDSGILDMAYQQSPNNMLWCVRNDGKLAAFTFEPDESVRAWALHSTDGDYKSVTCIPKTSYDELWFIVEREVDGVTRKYIEYQVAPEFDEQEDAFFVHSGLTIDSPYDITNIITNSYPSSLLVTCASHGFSNLDVIKIRGVEGMTEVNGKKYYISDSTTDTFKLKDSDGNYINGDSYADYDSGGEARECFSSISGLDHLEGEIVQICADGGTHPTRSVSSGTITLNDSYSQASVGLGYTARLKTNDIEGAPGKISSKGKLKRILEVFIDIYNSLGFTVGTDSRMDTAVFRTSDMATDAPPELFTGIKRMSFPSGWSREKSVIIEQDQPLPLHIRSITAEIEVN